MSAASGVVSLAAATSARLRTTIRSRVESIRSSSGSRRIGLPAVVLAPFAIPNGVIAATGIVDHGSTTLAALIEVSEAPWLATRWIALIVGAVVAAAVILVAQRRGWFRLSDHCPHPPAIAPKLVACFFGLLVAHLLGSLFARLLLGETELDPLARTALTTMAGYLAQVPVVLFTLSTLSDGPGRPLRLVATGAIGLALALPVVMTVSGLGGIAQTLIMATPPPKVAHETLQALIEAPSGPWPLLVVLGVLIGAPIVEEVAYRGALQGAFRAGAMRPWTAVVATSLVFMIMHVPAIPPEGRGAALGGLFTLSLFLGLLRERTRALVPCIVAHALFNAFNLVVARAT